jgi:hypothetical protein
VKTSLEVVMKEVFEKWKQQLRPASHNLWLGSGLAPRIIRQISQ